MCIINEISLLSRNPQKLFHIYPYICIFFSFCIALFRTLFFHLMASLKFMSVVYPQSLIFVLSIRSLFSTKATTLGSMFSSLSSSPASFPMVLTSSWPIQHSGLLVHSCLHFQGPSSLLSTPLHLKHPQKCVGHTLDLATNWNAPLLQSSLRTSHFLITLLSFFPLTYIFSSFCTGTCSHLTLLLSPLVFILFPI